MADEITVSMGQTLMETGSHDNTWGPIANDNFERLEEGISGFDQIATTGGATAVDVDTYLSPVQEITGTLGSNATITFVSEEWLKIIKNSTAGAFSVTVGPTGGTGVVIPQGRSKLIYSNGTDAFDLGFVHIDDLGANTYTWVGNFGGSATAMTATDTGAAPAALTNGMAIEGRITAANTSTTPSLDYASLGAKTIVHMDGSALVVGDLVLGTIGRFIYGSTADKWFYQGVPVSLMARLAANTFTGKQTFGSNAPMVASQVALTDASSVALDLDDGTDFILTATDAVGNSRTLDEPTGGTIGQRGHITFVQDATGGRSMLFDAAYKGHNLVCPPSAQGNGERTRYKYFVRATGEVELTLDWHSDASNDPFGSQFLHVQDQKASGTNGGTFTAGAWRTRVLNTVLTNEIVGASLASNTVTLPAGTYYAEGSCPAYQVSDHQAKLVNTTDGTDLLFGNPAHCDNDSDPDSNLSRFRGRFTLAAEKTIQVQHQSLGSANTIGFGQGVNFGVVNVYTDLAIWKIR